MPETGVSFRELDLDQGAGVALKTQFIGLWIIGNVLSSIEAFYRKGSLSLVSRMTIGAISLGHRLMQVPAIINISSNIPVTFKTVTSRTGPLLLQERRRP